MPCHQFCMEKKNWYLSTDFGVVSAHTVKWLGLKQVMLSSSHQAYEQKY